MSVHAIVMNAIKWLAIIVVLVIAAIWGFFELFPVVVQ